MSKTTTVAHVATQAENAQKEAKAPMSVVKTVEATQAPKLTVEERIRRHSEFSNLVSKYQKLDLKLVELQGFVTKNDGNRESVTLRSSEGGTIEVTNSSVVNEIIEILIVKTKTALSETAAKIDEFNF